jgi:thiol-disulfide isomerase/thioredoxin
VIPARIAGWLALAGMVAAVTGCDQSPPADRLIEGRPFPHLLLHEFDGAVRSIEDYRGRIVVLNVWATWCPPCRKELPSLERLHAQLDPGRFAVIGMSIDGDADIAREFLLDRGVTFKSYLDLEGAAADRVLGIRVYPDTFIISQDGVLLRKFVGEREWDAPGLVEALESAWRGDPQGLHAL